MTTSTQPVLFGAPDTLAQVAVIAEAWRANRWSQEKWAASMVSTAASGPKPLEALRALAAEWLAPGQGTTYLGTVLRAALDGRTDALRHLMPEHPELVLA